MVVDVTLTPPSTPLGTTRALRAMSIETRLSLGIAVSRDPRRFLTVRRVLPLLGQASAVVLMDNWMTRCDQPGHTVSTVPNRLSAALEAATASSASSAPGGMATVYLAEDLKHDRKVALKVLKPELAAVLGAERFVVEIKTTAALQHPHILPLFDSGDSRRVPVLRDALRRGRDAPREAQPRDAVRRGRGGADRPRGGRRADYAHRHGVIHRDIKPENILLHDGRAMVADFGIALAVSAAAGGRMTETGLSLGTPHYMSPEQATAEKEITGAQRTLLAGDGALRDARPASRRTWARLGAADHHEDHHRAREPVTEFRKSVPPNVAAAVAKALEKLPADRFESAKAFADALSNAAFVLSSKSVSSRHDIHARSAGRGRRVAASADGSGRRGCRRGWRHTCSGRTEALMQRRAVRPSSRRPCGLTAMSTFSVLANRVALAPDGPLHRLHVRPTRRATRTSICRAMNDLTARDLGAGRSPTFSPDSKSLAYHCKALAPLWCRSLEESRHGWTVAWSRAPWGEDDASSRYVSATKANRMFSVDVSTGTRSPVSFRD